MIQSAIVVFVFCHAKHTKDVYYQFEDSPDTPTTDAPAEQAAYWFRSVDRVHLHTLAYLTLT